MNSVILIVLLYSTATRTLFRGVPDHTMQGYNQTEWSSTTCEIEA